MLNWRRDPGYEQRRMLHEQRMQQLAIEIEQIKSDSEQIKSETEQIVKDTERLRRENARGRALLSSVDQLCFPPDSSSIPPAPTGPGSRGSSP